MGFPKLTRFLAHHDAILAKFLPKLKKHFDQCNLDSILYSLKWFFVIFIERVSLQFFVYSNYISYSFLPDSVRLMSESLGHLPDGRRKGRNRHGIHSIKSSQK